MNPLDYSSSDTFNPQNLEHWLLLLSFLGAGIYGFWLVSQEEKEARSTHRYNRETGKVEKNVD
jgi:hypothetical protein